MASTATLVCDWADTRFRPDNMEEFNPIMGKNPTGSTVDVYFATTILFNAALWYALPEKYKSVIPVSVTAVQAKVLYDNNKYGSGVCGLSSTKHPPLSGGSIIN